MQKNHTGDQIACVVLFFLNVKAEFVIRRDRFSFYILNMNWYISLLYLRK